MPTIGEIRQQYPQYSDLSDTQLADALHSKFYADMPRDQFDAKVGLQAEPKQTRSWSQVPGEALSNVPSSAVHFGTDIVQPFIHPIQTYENMKSLGSGVLQKLGLMKGTENEKYADAVGKFLMDRYGSVEAIKNTIATDPVGIAADLSIILSGGETALARFPGVVGKVGEVAGTVGRVVDPLSAAGETIRTGGRVASEVVGGLTHTGGQSVRTAFEAGKEGGEAGRVFQENLRGAHSVEETVDMARSAVGNIRKERGQTYRDEMAKLAADKTVLNFDKVDNALASISGVKTYKGQVLSPSTQKIREEIGKAVANWKSLNPAEYHTAEGLDALKQLIGDIRDGTQYGTTERVVADQAYQAIRKTIVEQAPEYARIMKGYEEASKQIKEIERTLSLNPNASIDTALRKLQSVLRDNVNTNYGQRAKLAEYLVANGSPQLMEALAGQAMSSWWPRGLGKLFGAELASAGAGGALALMSPRAVGEAAYYGGQAVGALGGQERALARGAYGAGRLDSLTSPLAPGQ